MTSRYATMITAIALIIMMAFPKAGFYYETIPITMGYIILALLAVGELIYRATHHQRHLDSPVAYILVLLFGFAIVEMGAFKMYGYVSSGGAVAIVVSTLIVPLLSILATSLLLRVLGTAGYVNVLRWSLLIVFSFGLVSFIAFNTIQLPIGIPYLTTTGDDLSVVSERHNMRTNVVKMFSTYNNGNILGINLLLWGPIAAVGTQRSLISGVAFRSVCVLSLSRSVWAGLVALEVIGAFMDRSLSRIYRAFFATLLLMVVVIGVSLLIGHEPMKFLFDRDLGGRMSTLQGELDVISQRRVGWDSESIYAGAYLAFGPVGVVMVIAIWSIPVVFGGKSPLQQTARLACLVYLLVGAIEGAFLLVPTQAVYWSVATLALMHPPQMDALREEASRALKVNPSNSFSYSD